MSSRPDRCFSSTQWASTAGSNSSKRRRRLTATVPTSAPAAGAAASSSSSPWASMNGDLISLIAWRVLAGDLLDYVRFRAACRHWRSSTVCPRGRGVADPRFHPRRWMMLPEGHGLHPAHGRLRGYIRFFNLQTGSFVRVKLPVFRDHCALDSADGLLVMHRDHDTAIRLLHPFTGDALDLPPLLTLLPHIDPDLLGAWHPGCKLYYLRGFCASFSVDATGAVTVMLALHRMGRVAFATSGDHRWRLSSWTLDYQNPLSFQGKLYMALRRFDLAESSEIFRVDPPPQEEEGGAPSSSLPEPKLIATIPAEKLTRALVLAECDSQILVAGYTDRSRSRMTVYRLADLASGRFVPVRSIGDRALFVNERSLCVSAGPALPTVVGDTIVLQQYKHGVDAIVVPPEQRNGTLTQYHLDTDTWSRPMDGCILSGPVFGPCCLIHHIYTCCRREFWNKGQLYNRKKVCRWRVKGKWRIGA